MLKISNLKKLFWSKTVFESAELKLWEKEKAWLVRYIDEEMEELITDRLPLDTAIVIKIIMQSQHIESMTITKNIVLFVKWLWYEVDFTVGELTFIPKWCPEMQRICFIEHPNGSPEIYIKDAH